MVLNPSKLDYSGLGAKKIKRSDFTDEQLSSANIKKIISGHEISAVLYGNGSKAKEISVSITSLIIFFVLIVFMSSTLSDKMGAAGGIIIFILQILVGIFAVFTVYALIKAAASRRLRLLKFALDNNLKLSCVRFIPPMGPIMFAMGYNRFINETISDQVEEFMIANYEYTIGSGKYKQTIYLDFVRIKLPREVPHIYLNGLKNNLNASVSGYKTQKLNLEGDFNKYFNVFVPPNYHVDALQLLTPDVMRALIEEGVDYDYEMVNDNLYIYATPGAMSDMTKLRKLLTAVDGLQRELGKQARTYSDVRADNTISGKVAFDGATLRKKPSRWLITVTVVVIGLSVLYPLLVSAFDQGIYGFIALVASGIIAFAIFSYLKSSKGE